MISEYFKKYCSYYLSRYSVSKKKFEDILKKKIRKDFFSKKFDKTQYHQYLNEIDNIVSHYGKLGYLDDKRLIDIKVDNLIEKGFSRKKIYFYLKKNLFADELIKEKILDLEEIENLDFKLIKNYLKKKSFFNNNLYDISKKDYFDKILMKLIKEGFDIEVVKKFLRETK